MAKLTATEKETIILFNEKEDTVEVYTYNGKIKRNIEKARSAAPHLYRLIRDGGDGSFFFLPVLECRSATRSAGN